MARRMTDASDNVYVGYAAHCAGKGEATAFCRMVGPRSRGTPVLGFVQTQEDVTLPGASAAAATFEAST